MECYVAAIELDNTFGEAWFALSQVLQKGCHEMRINVSGEEFTELDCLVKALECGLQVDDGEAWNNLGICLGQLAVSSGTTQQVEIGGNTYDEKECQVKALEMDKSNSTFWNNLGTVTNSKDGSLQEKIECFKKAIQRDNEYLPALRNLYRYIKDGEITINKEKQTQELCHEKIEKLEKLSKARSKKDQADR